MKRLLSIVGVAVLWPLGASRAQLAAPKALEGLAVLRQIFGKKLESDEAAETRVLRFIDHTHPAATELFDDPVM